MEVDTSAAYPFVYRRILRLIGKRESAIKTNPSKIRKIVMAPM
jgi:hypothetical protein